MSLRAIHCVTLVIGLLVLAPSLVGDDQPVVSVPDYTQEVLPILISRCGHCHGPETQEARIRFDQLSTDLSGNRAAAQTWREALHAMNAGEMPPEDEPPLNSQQRETLTRWISSTLKRAIAQQRSTGGRVVLRRLNRDEYQNTMFDLLGLDMDYVRDLPPDGLSPDGFRNDGQSLLMSAIQLETCLDTARRALEKVVVSGPPPKVFRHRFEQSNVRRWRGPTETSNRLERAQKFLARIVDDYPEEGEFRIRVRTGAHLKADKGFPLLEVAVGYRPDTEVYFRVVRVREVVSEDSQQFEFRGRIENFPLPVRGQGKFPGLVIRCRNLYDDGTPRPTKLEKIERDGETREVFREEPHLPHLLIESVEFEGPVFAEWPPSLHRRILFASELRDSNEVRYLKQVLHRFMSRAYRRPPTRREVEDMFSFFASIRPHFTRFEDAVRETLAMVLIQPDFLYLMEPGGDQKRMIGDWELASRLSYFLWSSMPDQRLFELASVGLLNEPRVLEAEVQRMLADKRAQRFTTEFVNQWLRLDGVDQVFVDPDSYPDFHEALKSEMRSETTEFFVELLHTDSSALNLLKSDFTMLNEPLARHYGIEGVYGKKFRRVDLPEHQHRGGLLGHASILLANSSGHDSHPIRRAVWIRDRLLGDPPAPPPPDVPELDETNPEFTILSVREQLEIHRGQESCASCHRDIDPWGIALENFDAVGRWRDSIRKKHGDSFETRPVLAEAVLPDGTRIQGADGLKEHLVQQRKGQFARALVRSLLTYALGRTLELSDEAELDDLTDQFIADGFHLQPLIQRIVDSEAFRTK